MKNNGYIFETDSFRIKLYTKQETCEMFGLDYLEDYGHTIPEDLLNRYLKNEKEWAQKND
jgi:hypothetical protein